MGRPAKAQQDAAKRLEAARKTKKATSELSLKGAKSKAHRAKQSKFEAAVELAMSGHYRNFKCCVNRDALFEANRRELKLADGAALPAPVVGRLAWFAPPLRIVEPKLKGCAAARCTASSRARSCVIDDGRFAVQWCFPRNTHVLGGE
jgi:hypothetical protein